PHWPAATWCFSTSVARSATSACTWARAASCTRPTAAARYAWTIWTGRTGAIISPTGNACWNESSTGAKKNGTRGCRFSWTDAGSGAPRQLRVFLGDGHQVLLRHAQPQQDRAGDEDGRQRAHQDANQHGDGNAVHHRATEEIQRAHGDAGKQRGDDGARQGVVDRAVEDLL